VAALVGGQIRIEAFWIPVTCTCSALIWSYVVSEKNSWATSWYRACRWVELGVSSAEAWLGEQHQRPHLAVQLVH